MIPRRIALAGFLSYREPQELTFADARLWLLGGPNGSGKSAVFDAVTYALFGHHRGGSVNAVELMHKDAHDLSVELDFRIAADDFRVRRTLRRSARGATSGTQQIFRRVSTGAWEPIPDTNRKADFDDWIARHIGLSYETFTSSVLLLQGKAEKLLEARPSGRAEVLADVVALGRYQRLHEAANAKKLTWKARLDVLTHQAAAVPEVTAAEFAGALERIATCQRAREAAKRQVDAATDREAQARRWAEAEARLAVARTKLTEAEALLGDATGIESRFARWRELQAVLPAANTVIVMQARVLESRRKTEKYHKDRDQSQERKRLAEANERQLQQQRADVERQVQSQEKRREEVTKKLRELQGQLEAVKLVEQQESESKRLEAELARLPADPESALKVVEAEAERLTELARVAPILERFAAERKALGEARESEQAAKLDQQRVQTQGATVRTTSDELATRAAAARQAKAAAEDHAAAAKALATQARAAAAEFATLDGAKTCRACGQALTAQHFATEKKSREEAVVTADANLRAAQERLKATTLADEGFTRQETDVREELARLRDAYRDHAARARQAAADVQRLLASLAVVFAELPQAIQTRIAPSAARDWTATKYPSATELDELRTHAAELEAARRRLREAMQTTATVGKLRSQTESVRQSLARLRANLPADGPAAVRQHHQLFQAEEATLATAIKAGRKNLADLEIQADQQGRDAHAATLHLTDLAGRLHAEEVTCKHCEEAADRALATLPESWRFAVQGGRMADYSGWSAELEQLSGEEIDKRHAKLSLTRAGLAVVRDELTAREADVAGYPPPVRLAADAAHRHVVEARAALESEDAKLRDAEQARHRLETLRDQRALLSGEFQKIDNAHNRYKQLAELLGRDRLQRHLVREAEREIVAAANAVLHRLSGDQLALSIVPGEVGADRALDLECTLPTAGGPIPVAFLSGSQKFRVAVSLALGIGQYARRQTHPIETIIIDEGFASLDREGRSVMIRELQNLRDLLKCVIVVSHQDDFADAFPDGYHFELKNGTTVISPIRRSAAVAAGGRFPK